MTLELNLAILDHLFIGGWIGAAIGAVASFIGSKQQNDANSARTAAANQYSDAQAQRQMDFQERMSNTAYQRGMDDMRAAGLNPILAYKQGGASAPTGAAASAAQPIPAIDPIGKAVSSALAVKSMQASTTNLKADTAIKTQKARTAKQEADAAEQYGPRGGIITTLERTIKTLMDKFGINYNSAKNAVIEQSIGKPTGKSDFTKTSPPRKSLWERLKTPSPYERQFRSDQLRKRQRSGRKY